MRLLASELAGLPEPDPDAWISRIIAGRYHVVRCLGSGGTGIVFEAVDLARSRKVALKVLRPLEAGTSDARRRFEQDAAQLSLVRHEHLAAVECWGILEDERPYLV
ncbi:MAG: hypothetical protein HC923_11710, partial [Myxococcales bacterium]|nr:hypothetical protein [Myxococcales bacterium]